LNSSNIQNTITVISSMPTEQVCHLVCGI